MPIPSHEHRGWHSRGYLPHFDVPEAIQSINFRLHDSVPAEAIAQWKSELAIGEKTAPDSMKFGKLRWRIARFEDAGHGSCFLRNPAVADMVQNAILHFDIERYRLLSWCIMPNHVHTLVEVKAGYPLSGILHSWKSFTANEANKLL